MFKLSPIDPRQLARPSLQNWVDSCLRPKRRAMRESRNAGGDLLSCVLGGNTVGAEEASQMMGELSTFYAEYKDILMAK